MLLHMTIFHKHRYHIVILYTQNLYNVISQCYLNKFNLKRSKLRTFVPWKTFLREQKGKKQCRMRSLEFIHEQTWQRTPSRTAWWTPSQPEQDPAEKWAKDWNRCITVTDIEMTDKNKCSVLGLHREMQIKITIWYYGIYTIMFKLFKKLGNTKCWWQCGVTGTITQRWWETKLIPPFGKSICQHRLKPSLCIS